MSTHQPLTFLHISDIQLMDPGTEDRQEGIAMATSRLDMADKLVTSLAKLKPRYGLAPQAIIVSGDLTERGEKAHFDQAKIILDRAIEILNLEPEQVIIVPGNHDINWVDCKKQRTKKTPEAHPPYEEKWFNFQTFFDDFYRGCKGISFERHSSPWSLFELPDEKTVLAGFNSTWAETDQEQDHYGLIGAKQLNWFDKELKKYREDNWLRIAVLHHNVSATNTNAELKDKNTFLNEFVYNELVNITIHGHTHVGDPDTMGVTPILSTGSAIVEAGARPVEVPNQYQVIQIWPKHFQQWAWCYSYALGDWIGDCSISIDGDSWQKKVRRQQRFASTEETFASSRKTALGLARGFLEAGDLTAGLALTPQELPKVSRDSITEHEKREAHAYMSAKQKFGVFDKADLDWLRKVHAVPDQSVEFDFKVLELKMQSQRGALDEVDKLYKAIQNKFPEPVIRDSKKRGVINRYAVCRAIHDGVEAVNGLFEESLKLSQVRNDDRKSANEHAALTSNTLHAIASVFCTKRASYNRINAVNKLREAQSNYSTAAYEQRFISEVFPFKSAVQALFSEAAVHLDADYENPKGWNRLIAAHLLASRCAVTPCAEGYAELLHMVWHKDHYLFLDDDTPDQKRSDGRMKLHELLTSAIYSEAEKRTTFLTDVLPETLPQRIHARHLLSPMWEVYDLIPNPSPLPNDWKKLQHFLNSCDQQLSEYLESA